MKNSIKLAIILIIFLVQSAIGAGNEPVTNLPDPASHLRPGIPDPHSSQFGLTGPNFFQNEISSVLGRFFNGGFVFVGDNANSGLHATASGCTSAAFDTEAFVRSNLTPHRADRVRAKSDGSGGTAAINYTTIGVPGCTAGTSNVTVAICTSAPGGNWINSTGSNYYVDFTDAAPAGIPSGCAGLMQVTINAGNITAIGDLRKQSEIESTLNLVLVPVHATGGDGSPNSCWTGWDSALASTVVGGVVTWARNGQDYVFPPGCYTFSSNLIISGSNVKFVGSGISQTIFNWAGTSGIAILFDNGTAFDAIDVGGFKIVPSGAGVNAGPKTALEIHAMSGSYVHDTFISLWYDSTHASHGLRIAGRDTSSVARIISDADRPVRISQNPYLAGNGLDTTTFTNMYIGQLNESATAFPCYEVDDGVSDMTRVIFNGTQAVIKCKHAFYWNTPTALFSSQDGPHFEKLDWEQNTDPTGWLIWINHGQGVQNLSIKGAYGGLEGNGIYLQGLSGATLIENTSWTGSFSNPNNSGVGLKVQNSAGIQSANYVSGGTITGTVGQTCTCNSNWNNSGGTVCSGSPHVTFTLSSMNTIAPGAAAAFPDPFTPGSGCTGFPTRCTLGNGTATCSGTATITSVLNGTGNAVQLTIVSSFLDGDKAHNTLGLDPCTGASGYPTGTHNCIMGMTSFLSTKRSPVEDIGTNAVYVDSAFPNAFSTVAGNKFFPPPAGIVTPTTSSRTFHIAAGTEPSAPWIDLLDCPGGLSPCSGTFKYATVRIRVIADDSTFSELAFITIDNTSYPTFPNVMTCTICTPHIDVNGAAAKVVVYHGPAPAPTFFYGIFNRTTIGVTVTADLEVTY